MFKKVVNDWVQDAQMKASNIEFPHSLGYSVSISLNTILVTTPIESGEETGIVNNDNEPWLDNNHKPNSGAAYKFKS